MQDYIFRKYDIRGEVERDFPQSVVEKLGRAFGTFTRRQGGDDHCSQWRCASHYSQP